MKPAALLIVASLFAATQAAGVLFGETVWRFAELSFLAALLAYLAAKPPLRWAPVAALAVLSVDAIRTLPAPPGSGGPYYWTVINPANGIDTTAGFESALDAWWSPLVAVVILLAAGRGRVRPSRAVVVAVTIAAVVITGYATVRVTGVKLGPDEDQSLTAVVLAVLTPIALGLAALALTAVLTARGRRLAAVGSFLLALLALPYIDSAIAATPLPYGEPGLFGWNLITPTLVMPQPMPALTTALQSIAFKMLTAGIAGARRPGRSPEIPDR